MPEQTTTSDQISDRKDKESQDLVDAVVGASRVLVGVAARSLMGVSEDVTLPQFRALVVLDTHGPRRVVELAEALGVNASTATRMCDRLVRKHLVRRTRLTQDRRTVRISLTESGHKLVGHVTRARRQEVRRILEQMPQEGHAQLVSALRAFAEAAGELPSPDWALGWDGVDLRDDSADG